MSWSVQTFRLVSKRTDPGLFCAKDGLTLGGIPLLAKATFGYRPQPIGDLQKIFDAAYGAEGAIDANSRLSCLWSVARALNDGDLSHATLLSLMLRLPGIDPNGLERLNKASRVDLAKYDDDESRDRQGRWTSDGGGQNSQRTPSQTPPRGSPNASADQGASARSTGRWPDRHRGNPNIVPAQVAIPIPPPLIPGGGLGSPKPKDDDILFPSFNTPQTSTGQHANDNTATDARAANDNDPSTCPNPSFEVDSVGRTTGQLNYQAQISGLPLGMGVKLNGVEFDGCRESDGTMLEAKNVGPWFFKMPDFIFRKLGGYQDTINQAFRQMYASGGRKIEWHFSNPRVAGFWKRKFASLGYKISVRYTPIIPAIVKLFYFAG